MRNSKIEFHGAARGVTGSKHIIESKNGIRILLDCGMFQGHGKETDELNRNWGFDPGGLHAMVLSHAHIDHCGLLPRLVKHGFNGPIYCTEGTRDLLEIMLQDSAEIQESDIKFLNKKRAKQGKSALKPLYNVGDVEAVLELVQVVDYNQRTTIFQGIDISLQDAGHMIGSASVHVDMTYQDTRIRVTFSGDVGQYDNPILRAPQAFPESDYLILESTYGDSLHDEEDNTEAELLANIVQTCLEKQGKLIIPAFSVGRTQEILQALNNLELENKLPPLNYYVDSPLSTEATQVIKKHKEYYNEDMQKILAVDNDPFGFKGLHYIKSAEESKALNSLPEPCVIISSSGMADAGRVKHHILNNIENKKNTILFVGHCEPQSLGGQLLNGNPQVRIFGDKYDVHADIARIHSMSAHGDAKDLINFVSSSNIYSLKKVFLVHGEIEPMMKLRESLLRIGVKDVEMPDLHSEWLI